MDARSENAKKFALDATGKVIGIELGITTVPNAKYEVYSVSLINEYDANGQTIASCKVIDKNGIETGEQVRLAWAGKNIPFQDSALSGSGNNVHVISNGFTPPNLGPLALHVGGFNAPTSDIIYGFGLPFKHHVSFNVIFREKGSIPAPNTDLEKRVIALEKALTQHAQMLTDLYARVGKIENPVGGGGSYALPTSRVGVHWIPTGNQSHKDYIKNLKPSVIKVVNGNRQDLEYCLANIETNGIVVVRDHARSEQHDFLRRDPIGCGKQHALEWKNDFAANGKYANLSSNKIVVCGLNEPNVQSENDEKIVLAYTTAFLNDLKLYGIRGLALNLSVGWVRNLGDGKIPYWDTFLPLENVINDGNHILGLHEYWYNDPDESWTTINDIRFGWRAFRHLACPMQVPIIIGECGLTKEVDSRQWIIDGKPPRGWIGNVTPRHYAEQLWRYARKCSPNVIAVLPFTTGMQSNDWAEDATDTAHADIVSQKEKYVFPANFPIVPDAKSRSSPSSTSKTMIFPFIGAENKITQYFGEGDYSRFGLKGHNALDFGCPINTPILSVANGEVVFTGTDIDYGNYVRIYYPTLHIFVLYAHLNKINVQVGQIVAQGDIIGLSGSTGNSTGPHLHFECRAAISKTIYDTGQPGFGSKGQIDPFALFRVLAK